LAGDVFVISGKPSRLKPVSGTDDGFCFPICLSSGISGAQVMGRAAFFPVLYPAKVYLKDMIHDNNAILLILRP
jgi:hypothetical protein